MIRFLFALFAVLRPMRDRADIRAAAVWEHAWCCPHPAQAHDDNGCPATGCPCSADHRLNA